MSRYALLHGGVLEHLRTLPSCSADALLCDPPYGLGNHAPTGPELVAYLQGSELDTGGDFMGKAWHVPSVAVWREAFRVLKPGAPLLAFAGSRTGDLISLGLRAAGFEIRDCLMWLYGSGFPKSQSIDKAIDAAAGATREVVGTRTLTGSAALTTAEKGGTFAAGTSSAGRSVEVEVTAACTPLARAWSGYGTALKPAFEPIILARKPLEGTMAANVARWGVGGLAIDASRLEGAAASFVDNRADKIQQNGYGKFGAVEIDGSKGRWPANVILDEAAGAALDAQTGNRPGMSGGGKHKADYPGGMFGGIDSTGTARGDQGGASRFFYTAKVSKSERERGCEGLPQRSAGEVTDRNDGDAALDCPRTGAGRTSGSRNHHPTLKPIALITYLARLILPPSPGVLLVPYSGSGSEIAGALLAGWPAVVGIERESDYVTIAAARIPAHVPGARRVA